MGLSIGQLAEHAGVSASAVRYYEGAGLLRPPGRRSGRRVYDAAALKQLAFITRARSSGFSIAEIRDLVGLMRGDGGAETYCDEAKSFARSKIIELDDQIAQARALRAQLIHALATDCSGLDDCAVISG
uniref:MerR family transcriptional regulator n=1 Tax=Parerythrobacter lutipelagi TaxID=1964208 RepID=UPI0010F48B1F|nr:MerR family transcriptional regulator [Parerythrobacter lutipelagi]